MPKPDGKSLLKMNANRRWATCMNAAWHDLKDKRPKDARFYTDYAPKVEVPDPEREPFEVIEEVNGKRVTRTVTPVKREVAVGKGRIQVWRPGSPKRHTKDALTEEENGQPWHGFAAVVDKCPKGRLYEECKKAVIELLSKFKE